MKMSKNISWYVNYEVAEWKYTNLRTLGFDMTNDIFTENAWYFRNLLVRANYNDLKNGIHETAEFLEVFLPNLLLNENSIWINRAMWRVWCFCHGKTNKKAERGLKQREN